MKRDGQNKYCAVCGALLHGRQKNYCSSACQRKSLKKPTQIKFCLYCGSEFIPGRRQFVGRFCSRNCSALYYGRIRTNNKNIIDEQNRRLRTLKKKAKVLTAEIKALERELDKIKPCLICGELFITHRTNQQQMCGTCRKKSDNIRRDRRLYKNGKPDLSITLEKVYKRDLGICQLCNNHIVFGNDSNADNYPSIDHIKPLSKGGLHSWDNVQLVCRRCNTLKGNREPQTQRQETPPGAC